MSLRQLPWAIRNGYIVHMAIPRKSEPACGPCEEGKKRLHPMLRGISARPGLQRLTTILALTAWLAAAACAAPPRPMGPKTGPDWVCDREADRALSEGDLERGIRLHEDHLKAHPDNALTLYHLGYAYSRTGDHEQEIACYERAAALGFQDEGLFFNLGMAYGETGQSHKAVTALQRAVDTDRDNADYRVGLGLALESVGDPKGAGRAFEKALRLNPSSTEARWYLARTLVKTGHYDRARALLREILEIDPAHPDARGALEHLENMD